MEIRVLSMELKRGDRITAETGEWEIISRPYVSAGGELVTAQVEKDRRPRGHRFAPLGSPGAGECGPASLRRGGSTYLEVADLSDGLPNAGLEHPFDSIHRRSLALFHFYAAPRFLPFVLDG